MKNTKITLVPLMIDDREQFILDNQRSFKYGAVKEFGKQDDCLDCDGEVISRKTIECCIDAPNSKTCDGEVISRKTIERCIDAPNSKTYRIIFNGKNVGGVIVKINNKTHHNELKILFVIPEEHTKGIGYGAWQAVESLYPKTEVWETCTPYFEKRNIHFYVNKCGFQIDQFWCKYFQPDQILDEEEHDPNEGPDEMFRFIKIMK